MTDDANSKMKFHPITPNINAAWILGKFMLVATFVKNGLKNNKAPKEKIPVLITGNNIEANTLPKNGLCFLNGR